jgi:hypothetical protein
VDRDREEHHQEWNEKEDVRRDAPKSNLHLEHEKIHEHQWRSEIPG